MNQWNQGKCVCMTSMMLLLTACAGTGNLVSAPGVSLRNVQVTSVDFSGQTFLLGFDVVNPNSFPLPVKSVSYGIELGGYQFAGGRAPSSFTIPAQSDGEFAISVELDLLNTAPQLLFIIRDGVSRDIPYELSGTLTVDIPFAKPVAFSTAGEIRLSAGELSSLR